MRSLDRTNPCDNKVYSSKLKVESSKLRVKSDAQWV